MSEEPKPAKKPTKPAPDAAKVVVDDVELVAVRKDGDTIDVHPSCLAAHVRAGWKVA